MLTPQAASPHRPKPGGFLHGLVATTPGKRVVVKPKDGKLVPARVLDRPWVQKNGFGKISDPVIHAMCWYLTAPEISALAATCRRLQAQTQHEPVWKAILEKAYPSLAGKDRNMPDSMRLRYLGERRRLKVKDNDATKVEWDSWRYEGRALVFRVRPCVLASRACVGHCLPACASLLTFEPRPALCSFWTRSWCGRASAASSSSG